MKITKYEHACLVVEHEGQNLVIDPGIYSESFTEFANITGVVITHMHPDHFDPKKIALVFSQNPNAMIFTVNQVSELLEQDLPRIIVAEGQQTSCGPFILSFYGGRHATAHISIPAPENIGVMVNKQLYYPGDSFTIPHQPVDMLAVPASGPWSKAAEAMDFIIALKPKTVFPTHDALLSEIGRNSTDTLLKMACESVSASYKRLGIGSSHSG